MPIDTPQALSGRALTWPGHRDAVKINTAPIGSTSYSDTGLAGGASHTYTVTAVDAAANESGAGGSWSGAAGSGAVTTT